MPEVMENKAEPVFGVSLDRVFQGLLGLLEKRRIRFLGGDEMPEVMGQSPLGVCFCQGGEPCICMRDGLPIEQKTYVLAHELGHFMLHRNEKVWPRILFDGDYYDRIEREANTFTKKLIALVSLRMVRSA